MADKIQELNTYVVLINNDLVLLLKRHNGLWEFPGGGVEWGEHPDQTARRETTEECGLEPLGLQLIGVSSATYIKDGKEKHSVYIVYKSNTSGTKFVLSGEHTEGGWFKQKDLESMNLALNAKKVLDILTFK